MLKNKYQKNIYDKVLSSDVKILLPEIEDERISLAIDRMKDLGFKFIDLNIFNDNRNFYKEKIYKKKFIKNWSEELINGYLDNNFIKGLMLLEDEKADCLVAGATIPTADVLRSSIRIIGTINKWVSSTFLMISSDFDKAYTYSDCGVIPEPNADQLVEVAYNAAKSHELLTLEKAKIAFLSFSTKGSAKHYKVERMQEALKIFSIEEKKIELQNYQNSVRKPLQRHTSDSRQFACQTKHESLAIYCVQPGYPRRQSEASRFLFL